jgi:hypothetical protein
VEVVVAAAVVAAAATNPARADLKNNEAHSIECASFH